ncbi:MAG: hypothetical protein KF861_17060 [Planctomycetaceae bacterium]|nr:hypothetical protein [Planctomycetaceae bacterium]
MSESPLDLFQAGQLDEAVQAALAAVKKTPAEINPRWFLAELLCYAGDLKRADKQLDVLFQQHVQIATNVALFRQLIRAETWRRETFDEGRVPELLTEPNDALQDALRALACRRAGENAEADSLLAAIDERRVPTQGTCDGKPFDDLRDLDDQCAPFVEVLTSTGKYYWIPFEVIELMEFRRPSRPRDLLWRPVHMIVRGGPDGEVYIPCLYDVTRTSDDRAQRLGRATDWLGDEGAPIRGIGLRTWLVGDDAQTILQIGQIEQPDAVSVRSSASASE